MDERLNQQHLIELLAEMDGVSKKDADIFVREFFHLIEDAIEKDGIVKVKGLGTFKLVRVESRESVNINTGERFTIDGYNKISFTPDLSLRELINKPFEHFEAVELNDGIEFSDIVTVHEEVSESVLSIDEVEITTTTDNCDEESINDIEQPEPIILENKREASIVSHESVVDAVVVSITDAEVLPIEEDVSHSGDALNSVPSKSECQQEEIEKDVVIHHNHQNHLYKYLVLIPVFVLIFCMGVISYLYFPELFQLKFTDAMVEEKEIIVGKEAIEKASQLSVVADSNLILTSGKDSPVVVNTMPIEPIRQKETPQTKSEVGEDGTQPDSINYKIVGTKTTYTVKPGETLTRVALRFYGTKNLWPYIVKHNPNKIKNPNNVPSGTVLRIPEIIKK